MVIDIMMQVERYFPYRNDDMVERIAEMTAYMLNWWGVPKSGKDTIAFRGWFNSSSAKPYNCFPQQGLPDLTLMYPAAFAWLYSKTQNPVWREWAETIFYWGVGTRMDGAEGPYITASSTASRKVRREIYCFASKTFTYLREGDGG
jgi:hypothetical protein